MNVPGDGASWTQAKLNVQVTDMTYSQIVDHLVKVHLLLEPLCVVLQRRLSSRHPLHQLLKFHCRGGTVTNNLGVPNLVSRNSFTDQLNAFGSKGSNELLIKAYEKFGWEQTDFIGNLEVSSKKAACPASLLFSRLTLFHRGYIELPGPGRGGEAASKTPLLHKSETIDEIVKKLTVR